MPPPSHELVVSPPADAPRRHSRRWLRNSLRSPVFWFVVVTAALALAGSTPRLFGHRRWAFTGLWELLFVVGLIVWAVRSLGELLTRTLWSLRNRLLAAYVLVGVVPVLLIAGMVAISAYLFYGQYAAYLVVSQVKEATQRVGTVNDLTARELERSPDRAADAQALGNYYASRYFMRNAVQSYFFDASGKPEPGTNPAVTLPAWLQTGGNSGGWVTTPGGSNVGIAADPTGYAITAFRRVSNGATVVTSYRLTSNVLTRMSYGVGLMRLGMFGVGETPTGALPSAARAAAPSIASTRPLRAAANVFDIQIDWESFIPARDWVTGAPRQLIAYIDTRPSLLNDRLFASFAGENPGLSRWPLIFLGIVGSVFVVIELFSLVAGIRLTKTITGAVDDLYTGTVRVNRGDFEHRIPVRRRDQLAALEHAFNAMIGSIHRLLQEQQQKQRLEGELAIAHEVQLQLFRQAPLDIPGLEVFGRCLPARIVSGDYYDFIRLGPEELSLALGDISGKGISAALLMATIVAAVRALQLARTSEAVASLSVAGSARESRGGRATAAAAPAFEWSPAALMAMLNNQIYQSTPPEKYATLFYGVLDAGRRRLRYTNAGHLAPAIFGARGRRRLAVGGMVVGLFEDVSYEEDCVEFDPGDLLAAWSDGITEPENEYGVEFGEDRLLDLIETHRHRPLPDIMQSVLDAVRDWSGSAELSDDVTLVLARLDAGPESLRR